MLRAGAAPSKSQIPLIGGAEPPKGLSLPRALSPGSQEGLGWCLSWELLRAAVPKDLVWTRRRPGGGHEGLGWRWVPGVSGSGEPAVPGEGACPSFCLGRETAAATLPQAALAARGHCLQSCCLVGACELCPVGGVPCGTFTCPSKPSRIDLTPKTSHHLPAPHLHGQLSRALQSPRLLALAWNSADRPCPPAEALGTGLA